MATMNYRTLPKVRDSQSYVYLEHGRLEQTKEGIEFINKDGFFQIPTASLTTILLGPGTSVTQAVVKSLAQNGCMLVWTGEESVRYYAHAQGETYKAYKLQKQAELVSNPVMRKKIALRMYKMRFKEDLPEEMSFERIMGMEGKRVREEYSKIAKEFGLVWKGRDYDRNDWNNADELNKALSTASACLNGVCSSAIVAAGYSTGLGFIHQGKQLSFVYDIADLYKTRIAVPIAFSTVAEGELILERKVRKKCRQAFRNFKILDKIIPTIEKLLDIDQEIPDYFDPDEDPTMPTPWWLPPDGEEEKS
jgi:CRISPR-associated protein Cas1